MGRQQHHKKKKRRRGWHHTGREDRHYLQAIKRLERHAKR